jgi:hypothetical protein
MGNNKFEVLKEAEGIGNLAVSRKYDVSER